MYVIYWWILHCLFTNEKGAKEIKNNNNNILFNSIFSPSGIQFVIYNL